MKFTSDVDIDFANRDQILDKIKYVPASIIKQSVSTAHNTGIYPTVIPVDPFTKRSSLDYQVAEQRGYIKIDLLNVGVYAQVRDSNHLEQLLSTPAPWDRLQERQFTEQLIHIGGHYDTLRNMPETVDSIPRMAMFLAVIRPAKRHLLNSPWHKIAETVWEKSDDGRYGFKKSHAVAYAHLVVVHMNLLNQQIGRQ